jgi:hypothetical protein
MTGGQLVEGTKGVSFLHRKSDWDGSAIVAVAKHDQDWGEQYTALYDQYSQAARDNRARKRARAPQVKATTEVSREFGEMERKRVASLRELIKLRMSRGYVTPTLLVGGNPAYRQEAQQILGLVSEEHPILKLFVSKVPKARWRRSSVGLRTGATKAFLEDTDSKLLALDQPYIDANKTVCGILRVDLDGVITVDDIARACADVGVPAPNLVVGWRDERGAYRHPHLLWLLEHSVPLTAKGERFTVLYFGVLRGFVLKLLPFGADPGGLYNPHRHKNPVSPLWDRTVMAQQPYQLATFKSHFTSKEVLEAAAAMSGSSVGMSADHPDPAVAAGSNRLFGVLSMLARRAVGDFRGKGRGQEAFAAWLEDEACRVVSGLGGKQAIAEKWARKTAGSVAKWTWANWRDETPTVFLTAEERARAHADGARKGAARRMAKTTAALKSVVLALPAELRGMDKNTVIAALVGGGVAGRSTLYRQWPTIAAALASTGSSEMPIAP